MPFYAGRCYILRPWSFFIWEEISRWSQPQGFTDPPSRLVRSTMAGSAGSAGSPEVRCRDQRTRSRKRLFSMLCEPGHGGNVTWPWRECHVWMLGQFFFGTDFFHITILWMFLVAKRPILLDYRNLLGCWLKLMQYGKGSKWWTVHTQLWLFHVFFPERCRPGSIYHTIVDSDVTFYLFREVLHVI